jgi:hypothetical protein
VIGRSHGLVCMHSMMEASNRDKVTSYRRYVQAQTAASENSVPEHGRRVGHVWEYLWCVASSTSVMEDERVGRSPSRYSTSMGMDGSGQRAQENYWVTSARTWPTQTQTLDE